VQTNEQWGPLEQSPAVQAQGLSFVLACAMHIGSLAMGRVSQAHPCPFLFRQSLECAVWAESTQLTSEGTHGKGPGVTGIIVIPVCGLCQLGFQDVALQHKGGDQAL